MNTDVEDLLREGMERFTADLRAPAGLIHQVSRQRRRRVALRSATAGGAALAAGAVALAANLLPGALGVGSGAPVVTAAYVVKHVSSALSAAEPGEIAQITVTGNSAIPGGKAKMTTAEEWSYGDQWRSVINSPAGHPVYDEGLSASSVYTVVSYRTRTWARQRGLGLPSAPVFGPPGLLRPNVKPSGPLGLSPKPPEFSWHGCAPVIAALALLFQPGLPGFGFSARSLPAASALRNAIRCGTLTVAGRQRIDGIDAIKLASRRNSPISETIWVTPGTYLPVRVVVRSGPGAPALHQTADITWLKPTAQNLRKLTVPIPAGFRHVQYAPVAQAILPILSGIKGSPILRIRIGQ